VVPMDCDRYPVTTCSYVPVRSHVRVLAICSNCTDISMPSERRFPIDTSDSSFALYPPSIGGTRRFTSAASFTNCCSARDVYRAVSAGGTVSVVPVVTVVTVVTVGTVGTVGTVLTVKSSARSGSTDSSERWSLARWSLARWGLATWGRAR